MTTNRLTAKWMSSSFGVSVVLATTVSVGCSSQTEGSVSSALVAAPCPQDNGPCPSPSPLAETTLWVVNLGGDATLQDFFSCVLEHTSWNTLAVAYPGARPMHLGAQVVTRGSSCTPEDSPTGSRAFYQCAADQVFGNGHLIRPGDVLLVVVHDGSTGGLDNSYSANPTNIPPDRTSVHNQGPLTITNPDGYDMAVVGAHVGDGTRRGLTIYAGHEAFEAQTDGVSVDCCDGQTPSMCPACSNSCARYSGGSLATIQCDSGTFEYERVGAYAHEFDGSDSTCASLQPTCTDEERQGSLGPAGTGFLWTCQGSHRYICDDTGLKTVQPCAERCRGCGYGVDDVCAPASCVE